MKNFNFLLNSVDKDAFTPTEAATIINADNGLDLSESSIKSLFFKKGIIAEKYAKVQHRMEITSCSVKNNKFVRVQECDCSDPFLITHKGLLLLYKDIDELKALSADENLII
jgi:hypothetical protein